MDKSLKPIDIVLIIITIITPEKIIMVTVAFVTTIPLMPDNKTYNSNDKKEERKINL